MPAGGEEKKKKKSVIRSSNLCSVVVLFLYNSLFILQYSVSGCFLTPASVSQLCILPVIVWSGLSTSLSPLLNLAHVSYLSASCILSSSNTFFSGNSSQFFYFIFFSHFFCCCREQKRSNAPFHHCVIYIDVFRTDFLMASHIYFQTSLNPLKCPRII